jgi:hypothetical protein
MLGQHVHPFQEKEEEIVMDDVSAQAVADSSLPLLVVLIESRKQALWQHRHCADEHKRKWRLVLQRLDDRIATGEKVIADRMDIVGFRVKREIVK